MMVELNEKLSKIEVADLLYNCCSSFESTEVVGHTSNEAAKWLVRHGLARWVDSRHYIEPTTEGRAAAVLVRATTSKCVKYDL